MVTVAPFFDPRCVFVLQLAYLLPHKPMPQDWLKVCTSDFWITGLNLILKDIGNRTGNDQKQVFGGSVKYRSSRTNNIKLLF